MTDRNTNIQVIRSDRLMRNEKHVKFSVSFIKHKIPFNIETNHMCSSQM